MPAVADPGSSVARAAHDLGLTVVPLTGPVSLLLALAASGLNGQNFAFVGYLPQDAVSARRASASSKRWRSSTGQTQLFIETPYRNAPLLQALVQTLQHNTRLAVARGLTLATAHVRSETVKSWRTKPSRDRRTPARRVRDRPLTMVTVTAGTRWASRAQFFSPASSSRPGACTCPRSRRTTASTKRNSGWPCSRPGPAR
jgi:hypothetical protein